MAQAGEALNRAFAGLKSKDKDLRLRASYELPSLLTSAHRGIGTPLP